jgi:hypothetical protein
MTDRTFGIEIECKMPAGVTRARVASAITHAGITARVFNYDSTAHNTQTIWKVITDGSLGYDDGVEVVSPILTGEDGLAQAAKVADVLKALNCTVDKACGLHVHVGAGDLDLPQMKKLAINFVHSETAFDAIVPPSRRKDENQFIRSNRTGFGGSYENEGINKAIAAFNGATTLNDLYIRVSSVADHGQRLTNARDNRRYRKLNLLPMLAYKTVEFRQHGGTVEAEKITNWVKLCVAFVERSKTSRPRPRTSTAPHVASAELGMLLTWLRLTPDTCKYFRQRRKEFDQRHIDRAAAAERQRALTEQADRQAAWNAGAAARAIAAAELAAEQARTEEELENNRNARAAEMAQAEAARIEARRVSRSAYFAERRAAAEAALAAARG